MALFWLAGTISSNITNIQVFYTSPKSFAFVNLKPLLPGHVLVSPKRVIPRMTELSVDEITDLFTTVQKVQKMLALVHFKNVTEETLQSEPLSNKHGSFNIAVQDGVDAGQTMPHAHVHIIPRLAKSNEPLGDEIYAKMNSEEGNIGGALYDRDRPKPSGAFPKIEDASREGRTRKTMLEEANFYRSKMEKLARLNL